MSEERSDPDARVRALLAELGSGPDGEPLPPAVAARLDDTLARLVAERAHATAEDGLPVAETPAAGTGTETGTGSGSGTVVPLRRRWSPRLVAAAAAVIVVGAGGVAAAQLGVLGGSESSTVGQDSAAGGSSAKSLTEQGDQADQDGDSPAAGQDGLGTLEQVPQLRTASFGTDVADLLRADALSTPERLRAPARTSPSSAASPAEPGLPAVPSDAASPDTPSGDTGGDTGTVPGAAAACPGPSSRDGAVSTPVRLDGRAAALLVHPERAGKQLVEAWSCAGDRRLASEVLTSR